MTETCAWVRDLLPELAAGVASGDTRARALAHLARCAPCRAELDDTAKAIDELALLAPAHEPAAGFETRVLAALHPRPTRRQPRWRGWARRVAALAAVAGLAGILGAGLAWRQSAADRTLAARYRHTLAVAHGSYLAAADIAAPTDPEVGHLFAYQGSPSWIFVTLTTAPVAGSYRVRVVATDGQVIDVGDCRVSNGHGSYGTTVDLPVRAIRRVELVAPGAPTLVARLH